MEKKERRKYLKRLTGLQILVIGIFLILGFNLWRLQIANASHYSELATSNVIKNVTTSAVRGQIVDKNNVILARSVPKFALTLDWTDLDKINRDWRDVVAKLAVYIKPYWPYTGQSVDLIKEDIFAMVRNQQRVGSYRQVVILEDVPLTLQAIVAEHANELPGVSIEPIPVRVYPQGPVLGQVLGYVREISPAEIEQFNNQADANEDEYRYDQGDLAGKAGVEKSYDTWLRGNHGIDKVGIDSNARPIKETLRQAQPGYTVKLTIDSELQKTTENELDKVIQSIRKTHPGVSAGAAVIIEVKTGKVLAMASRPAMDPNDLTGIISDETARRYFNSEDLASLNRALTGLYAPGSTFKMITGMAALQSGVVSTDDYFADTLSSLGPPEVQKQGVAEWGKNNFGLVNLYRGLAKSSNIYFQIIGRRVFDKQPEYIRQIAHEFGLGVTTGIDIPGEGAGIAPSPSWKKEYFKPGYDQGRETQLKDIEQKYAGLLNGVTDETKKKALLKEKENEIALVETDYREKTDFYVNWRLFDSFNNSIGQGYNSYSLIQMANYVATIVNGGKRYKPYLVDQIINPLNGEIVKQNQPQILNEVSISQENLEIIKQAMSRVTSGEGTASAIFADVPQFSGGAKTGTAQIGSKGTAQAESYNGMFVAFAPYDDPKIAFAGVVEYGEHGGDTSGKVAKAAFIKYFGWK